MKFSRRPCLRRRTLLKAAALGSVALPLPGLITSTAAQEDLPHLSEDSDAAQALSYTHSADSSDVRENSSAYCRNCRFFAGDDSTEWAGCTIFPGEAVNRDGWCETWVEG